MRTSQALLLFFFVTTLSACASDTPQDIRITVKNEWWLTVSPKGVLGISSLIDSNPLSMVGTKEGVIDYNKIKKRIISGERLTDQKPENTSVALVEDEGRFLVGDDLMFEMLQTAGKANKWQGAGLNDRLLALLDKRPLLKNKAMQNKALQPRTGEGSGQGSVPENEH